MTCGTTSVINTPTDQRRTFLQGEPKERGVEMHEKGLKGGQAGYDVGVAQATRSWTSMTSLCLCIGERGRFGFCFTMSSTICSVR